MQLSKVKTVPGRKTNYRQCRPLDYLYDPVYKVSSLEDHQRASTKAINHSVEFKICPVFNSMFTDLTNYPRSILCLKSSRLPPAVSNKSWEGNRPMSSRLFAAPHRSLDVNGADRHRFFNRASVMTLNPMMSPTLPAATGESAGVAAPVAGLAGTRTQATQTVYRESETQTDPWSPPYVVRGDTAPEIITLAHLSWGKGLPAGMHEIEIIERARVKRAWEKSLPPATDLRSIDKRRKIIEAIERDEWVMREEEIRQIDDMRLELMKKLLQDKLGVLTAKNAERIKKYERRLQLEKERKIAAVRHDTNRALRKLRMKHLGVNPKYHRGNVVDEHADRKSEWYGPQMRFGEHPQRAHEVIHIRSRFLTHVRGLEVLERMPRALPGFDSIRFAAPPQKKNFYELCIRETHWTEERLRQLHDDLRQARLQRFEGRTPLRLLKRIPKAPLMAPTPTNEGVPDWEEDAYQASVVLQKIIKGRAIQTTICKSRGTCRELIDELKSTHALTEAEFERRADERFEVMSQQRTQQLKERANDYLNESLGLLEGRSIASTLDFLSKELWRLQDERRAHAFALLAERERHRREAAEAGRRQIEERRRREHDEMFKQIVKVHQDTVDIYLEDLILDSMNWVAEDEAREYVRELAVRVDQAAHEANKKKDCIEQQELVADLIHNFVMPEVQKQLIREKMRRRQQKYLRVAHDAIYAKIDNLPDPTQITVEVCEDALPPPPVEQVEDDEDLESPLMSIQSEITEMLYNLADLACDLGSSPDKSVSRDLQADNVSNFSGQPSSEFILLSDLSVNAPPKEQPRIKDKDIEEIVSTFLDDVETGGDILHQYMRDSLVADEDEEEDEEEEEVDGSVLDGDEADKNDAVKKVVNKRNVSKDESQD